MNKIGIDDVSIRKGPCNKNPGDCSFDNSLLCSWSNADYAEYDWLIHQGQIPAVPSAPIVDQ